MTLCTEGTIVNQGDKGARAITLYCNSWHCDICQPRRQRQLIAQIADGHPERLLTLTMRPRPGEGPIKAARFMAMSFRILMRRIRAHWPKTDHQYFVVFEAHKSGYPHMHIALRGCYIDQSWLSREWCKLTGSPGVDIRAIRDPKKAGAYVAKYMGKDTQRFGTCKRYWCSGKWEVDPPEDRQPEGNWSDLWQVRDVSMPRLATMWEHMGWKLWREGETLYGGPEPPADAVLMKARDV